MWAVLIRAFAWFGATFLPRLLMGLGVFAVTAVASGTMITAASNAIFGALNGVGTIGGANVPQILQYAGVYDFVSILLGAYTAAFAIKQLKQQAAAAANAVAGAGSKTASAISSGAGTPPSGGGV